jgi:hypothetical protein
MPAKRKKKEERRKKRRTAKSVQRNPAATRPI